jgi:hypothetical protein
MAIHIRRRRIRGARAAARDVTVCFGRVIRDTTDVKRRVMTQPLVVRNHKFLHGWFGNGLVFDGRARKFRRDGRDWRATQAVEPKSRSGHAKPDR